MSSIFQTNSQADYLLRQQRAAMRPELDLGAGAAQKPPAKPAVVSGSNSEFFKAAADVRATEKARANVLARSSAQDNKRDAAQVRQAAEDRRLDALDKSEADRAQRSVENTLESKSNAFERPGHESSNDAATGGSKVSETAREANPGRYDNLEDRGATRPDSTDHAGHSHGAEAVQSSRLNGTESAGFLDTAELSGSEVGLINAYLSQNASPQNASPKKAEVSSGKVAQAYETVIANLGEEDVATLNTLKPGELPKLINAKASAYVAEPTAEPTGGEGSVVDHNVVADGSGHTVVTEGEEGVAADAMAAVSEELAAIIGADPEGDEVVEVSDDTKDVGGAFDMASAGQGLILDEDIDGTQLGDGVTNAGKEGGGSGEAAGKETKPDAQTTGAAAALKEAYIEAHTEEKGIEKEEKGKAPVTQKTLDSPSTNTRATTGPKTIPQQGGEALNFSIEELALDLGDAVDSADLVEAITGKDPNAGSGLSKEHSTSGHKQDMAAMKNDGKAEGMAQAKDAKAGVEAAKKTSSTAPKTFNFGKLQEGVFNGVDRGLRLSLASGGQNAKLTLRPESLGELRIKLTIGDDGQVQSKIMVDNATVKSLLDSDAARLKNIFSEQGLDLESYSVEVGGGWSGKSAKGGGSGFGFNGKGSQSAYGEDSGAAATEMDISAIAGGAYGTVGGGLDLFA